MPVQSSFTTQLKFTHALGIVRAIPPNSPLQPIAADKLRFYGLYKQATEGDINVPKPSSRQVVDYAKWKSWSRMKGLSPVEAQKLYVESLVQLLKEFTHRYPNHEQSIFIKKALNNLQFDNKKTFNDNDEDEDDLFQDAYDPTEFELQEHFLNNIEAEQVMQEGILNSPPTSQSSSFIHYPNNKYYEHRHSSVISPITSEFPITPMTSPGQQNTITGQWVLNQLQQHNNNRPFVHPMDFLQDNNKNDILSEPDTIDREVAAATANLSLTSPRQSPYTPKSQKRKSSIKESASTSSSSRKNKAFEQLQTEVTALTEQIDRLRQSIKSKEEKDKKLRWSTLGLVKVLLKHVLANSAILLILFYILWRRKSPIAYAILGHVTPIIQELLRKILQKVVFWKVTV